MGTVLSIVQEDALAYPVETPAVLGVSIEGALLVNEAPDVGSPELLSVLLPEVVTLDQTVVSLLVGNNDVVQALVADNLAVLLMEQEVSFSVIGVDIPNPAKIRWIDLVSHWAAEPVLVGTDVGGGDVWEYTYTGGAKLYRLIVETPYSDAFYRAYSGTAVSDLILDRSIVIN